ncbi:hypothetical protein EDB89DRAFT_2231941 [Lactarius sanguifluus]|nr:hypothetical protein EDB89DRAFT_2231941 [Lactarius sanguifluus]
MAAKEQVVHDRVNLRVVRLARRLDKSVNEANWLNAQKARKRLGGIRDLLDRLGAYMPSANEQVAPEPSRLELFLPAVLHLSPSVTRKPDLLTIQRPALPSPVTSGLLTTEDAEAFAAAAAADVDLLLGSADDESRAFLPPDRTASTTGTRDTGNDAGRSWRSDAAERGALLQRAGGGQGGLRGAEEMVGANLEVANQVRMRVHDHRGKALGTTCLTISSVVIVAIAFLIMFFVIRFT